MWHKSTVSVRQGAAVLFDGWLPPESRGPCISMHAKPAQRLSLVRHSGEYHLSSSRDPPTVSSFCDIPCALNLFICSAFEGVTISDEVLSKASIVPIQTALLTH